MFSQQNYSVKPEKFLSKLRVSDDNEKIKAAITLRRFVESDLKEVSSQAYMLFLDQLCSELKNYLLGSDRNEIKGALYALSCLIGVDFISIQSFCLSIANLINVKLITPDVHLSALEARLLGQMGLLFPIDFVEKQFKLASEMVFEEGKNEFHRQFSILMIREIALQTPTSFYQNVSLFYNTILIYIRDKNKTVREFSALTLRAALNVIVEREINRKSKERETKKNNLTINTLAEITSSDDLFQVDKSSRLINAFRWYKGCLSEALKSPLEMVKNLNPNDRRHQTLILALKKLDKEEILHGNLLILHELILCYNGDYLNLLSRLNKIADLQVLDLIYSTTNDSLQSVQTVLRAKWPSNSNIENRLDSLFLLDPVHGPNWNLAHLKSFSNDMFNRDRKKNFENESENEFGYRTKPTSSDTCGKLLQENLDKIWTTVFKAMKEVGKDNRLPQIIMAILPSLISLNVPAFLQIDSRHQEVFEWLFTCIQKDREKPYAILTIVIIAKYLRSEFSLRGYLSRFMPHLKACLSGKKRNVQLETAMFLSICIMSESLGFSFSDQMKTFLPMLFECGLSRLLVNTCQILADNIPSLKQEIQISLLKHLKFALSSNENRINNPNQMIKKPFSGVSLPTSGQKNSGSLASSVMNSPWSLLGQHMRSSNSNLSTSLKSGPTTLGKNPKNDVYQMAAAFNSERSFNTSTDSQIQFLWEQQCANTILALYILGTFDFEGFTLAHFIRHVSTNFINISDTNIREIRLEAVSACAHHIRIWLNVSQNSKLNLRTKLKTFDDVLTRLLTVGTSDPDPSVRARVFLSLDVIFDEHLAQANRLNYLFSAIFDESFEVRYLVMRIIGRLSDINPACVQPQLRKIFYMTLSELDHNGSTRNKEHSALLLVNMVLSVPRFFIPYADPLVFSLVPKIRNSLPPSLRSMMLVNSVNFFTKMKNQGKIGVSSKLSVNQGNHQIGDIAGIINSQAAACFKSQAKISELSILEDKGFLQPNLMNFALVSSQLAIQSTMEAAKAVNFAASKLHNVQIINTNSLTNGKTPKASSNVKIQLLKKGLNTARNAAISAVNAAITANNFISTTNTSNFNASNLDSLEDWIANSIANYNIYDKDYEGIIKSLNQLELVNNPTDWSCGSSGKKLTKALMNANRSSLLPSNINSRTGLSLSQSNWDELEEGNSNGLWSESTSVIISYLVTLGALSSVAPYTLLPHMNELVSLLSHTMLYKTCQNKRLVSIRILGQLITNLGFVVVPYKIDENLLSNLFHILRLEESRRIRLEVIRTLGYLGALDPLKLKIYSGKIDSVAGTGVALSSHEVHQTKELDLGQWELLISLTLESGDEFFSVCALSTLVKILRDPSLRSQHDKIVNTIVFVFRCLDTRAHHYFPLIMPDFFQCLRNIKDTRMQEIIIKHLERMVSIVGIHVKKFAVEIIEVVLDLWWSAYSVQTACIMLVSTLNKAMRSEFKQHIEKIIPTLIKTLINESNELNIIMLLENLPELSYNIDNYVHILIPAITGLMEINQESDFQRLLISSNPQNIEKMNFYDSTRTEEQSQHANMSPFNALEFDENIETAIEFNQVTESVGSIFLRKNAMECIARFCDYLDLDDVAWSIINPVCQLLLTINSLKEFNPPITMEYQFLAKYKYPELCQMAQDSLNYLIPSAVDLLTSLLYRMGSKFLIHLPLVQYLMKKLNIQDLRFNAVLSSVEKLAHISMNIELDISNYQSRASELRKKMQKKVAITSSDTNSLQSNTNTNKRTPMSAYLKKAWRCSHITSREDWPQWLKGMMTAFLRESPSPSIRACFALVAVSPTIAKDLFNAAFVSCWPDLTDEEQDELIDTLTIALNNKDQPIEISQTLLVLEEFMDHLDKYSGPDSRVKLPLSINLLADTAMRNKSYAKALYYKEMEFLEEIDKRSNCTPMTLSNLINIYDKLQLEEAAKGVLIYAQQNTRENLNDIETWHEKLHDWDRALNMYERKLESDRVKDKTELTLGRVRCLRALGQWNQIVQISNEKWDQNNLDLQVKLAPLASIAAWSLQKWDLMEKYSQVLSTANNFDSYLFKAIIAIKKNDYQTVSKDISGARECLDVSFNASTEDSYDRGYKDLISAQMLSELEEVIQYRLVPERRGIIKSAWHTRLLECQLNVDEWTKILRVHSLVLQPMDHLDTWLKFAALCRKNGRMEVSLQTIQSLFGDLDPVSIEIDEPIPTLNPKITFAYTKWLWAKKHHYEAIIRLNVLKERLLDPLIQCYSKYLTNPLPDKGPIGYIQESTDHSIVSRILDDFSNTSNDWHKHFETLRQLTSQVCIKLGSWSSQVQMRNPQSAQEDNLWLSQPDDERANKTATLASFKSYDFGSNINSSHETQNFVISSFKLATQLDPTRRKAWQSLAMANYSVFNHLDDLRTNLGKSRANLIADKTEKPPEEGDHDSVVDAKPVDMIKNFDQVIESLQSTMKNHISMAVEGFVNSIILSSRANLQDSLRLINLLVKSGHLPEICQQIREGFDKIQLENWLLVIQQLLARIDTKRRYVGNLIVELLIKVGEKYPQALVYPLILAFKSGGSDIRRYHASCILQSMEQHSSRLISEGFLLNEELIRCSISWIEMWSDCLEEASRVYFGEKDEAKMFRLLHPLHMAMKQEPGTIMEASFLQEFGDDLENCKKHCVIYELKGTSVDMQQAWEAYYTLYRNFSKRISSMTSLELAVASPRLANYGNDWQLCVPGSYDPKKPIVHISGLKNCLTIMTSKQRPRKFVISGSDGHSYMFLLKGHEDTRQDERVMQFFGLVNTLLVENAETLKRNLTIQRMAVIPLSTNTGLISWVSESDTLHVLVRDYREKTSIVMNIEHRKMLELFPDFDRLNIIQKTEVFEAALRETDGRDLAHILWLRGQTAEKWFEQRTNFTRSIATMSIVGYILGLGDRHPSNVLLSRETGKVIHIDFGDCFDVASIREKFPEKVPFRLTRMIIKAMEVTGIDGVFRHTCEQVMELLRSNRESLLAVLEAFIHDPLLQWVLLENKKEFPNQTNPANRIPSTKNQYNPQQQTTAQPHAQISSSKSTISSESTGNLSRMRSIHETKVRIFSDPNYPASPSLRDPLKVNAWRHHLCNGPWFGCYRKMKMNQKRNELGQAYVVRNGLDGFIFSMKTPEFNDTPEIINQSSFIFGNLRAKDVMDQVYCKLTGTERPIEYSTMTWNYFTRHYDHKNTIIPERIDLSSTQIILIKPSSNVEPSSGDDQSMAIFTMEKSLEVKKQVDLVIRDAMSHQNLCQMYFGWCPFW